AAAIGQLHQSWWEYSGPMDDLRTEIRTYAAFRELPCFLCGMVYEQQHAAVVLFKEKDQLGEICPRCLAVQPSQTAERVHRHATSLWARAEHLRQQAEENPNQTEAIRKRAAERLAFVRTLFALAERLRNLDQWPTT